MKKIESKGKLFYQFERFQQPDLFHFTSTKTGWGSDGKSRFTGDDAKTYLSFREELADAFKLQLSQLVFPRQNHGDRVQIVREPIDLADVPETDALITNQPGICICVQTADCVPILLHDPVQKVVAIVHAGWRGTVNQILVKTIRTMQTNFNTKPDDICVGIGPSISQANYEIGADVINQVKQQFSNHAELLQVTDNGKACLDLWKANKSLALSQGVPDRQIEIAGLCSYNNSSLFYSARRDGVDTGRMISGIMLS